MLQTNSKQRRDSNAQKLQSSPFDAAPLFPPEFVRLPRPKTRCVITGLSRSTLNELIAAGKVRAVRIRKQGALRGITLVNRESLLEFLRSLET